MKTIGKFILLLFLIGVYSCKKDIPVTPNGIKPHDLLSDDTYTSLVIEVVSITGNEPASGSFDKLVEFLNERLHKPGGISVQYKTISSPGETTYTATEIRDLEDIHRSVGIGDDQVSAFFFFLDAEYSESTSDSKVLGIAYNPTSMAIFKPSIEDFTGGIGQPSEVKLESAVLLHEFCHILGLVNNGTDMVNNHQDGAHGAHCDNEDCLMYYTVNSSGFVSELMGGSIPELDANCIADLQANGGK